MLRIGCARSTATRYRCSRKARGESPGRIAPGCAGVMHHHNRRVYAADLFVDYLLVLSLGLVAGTLGGVVGFGTSIMLMPALVLVYGPKQAVPIMAIASILANASRVAAWWRDVDWRTTLAYSATAMPAAAAGARTLLVLPSGVVEGVLGAFFIAMIPIRRWMLRQDWRLTRPHMAVVGAVIGYMTGIVVSTGPI